MKKINILNTNIDNLFLTEVLENLSSGIVFTPNVDHMMKLQKDREFSKIYNMADYKLCDSQVLMYASKFLGTPLKQKISGSDFFPAFYTYHKNNKDIKIFLLGGHSGVAYKAKNNINNKVEREIIVGEYSPSFGFENNLKECMEIVEMINKSEATVLAIGVGAPKQEKWIYTYKDKLPNIKIFLAVGATINFEAGEIKRSPKLLSNLGLEWLHRLLSEPQRLWKRYLIEDFPFIYLILKEKIMRDIYSHQGINKLIYFLDKTKKNLEDLFRQTPTKRSTSYFQNSGTKARQSLDSNDTVGMARQIVHPSIISRSKRLIDIFGALIGLGITAIIAIPIALVMQLDNPGPIFYSQTRCGLNGSTFKIWKFRSMVVEAEQLQHLVTNEAQGQIFKNVNDPRVTRIGRFLRRTSLDELPQFWNVLLGDMSLVGTRPPTVNEVQQYLPHHWQRLQVKPGITGEWQVNGRSNIKNFEAIVEMDLDYQRKWSVTYDISLLMKTLKVLLNKSGAY